MSAIHIKYPALTFKAGQRALRHIRERGLQQVADDLGVPERVVAGCLGAYDSVEVDDGHGRAERGVDAENHLSRVVGPWRRGGSIRYGRHEMRTSRGAASSMSATCGPAVPHALSTPVPDQPRSISTSHHLSATAAA